MLYITILDTMLRHTQRFLVALSATSAASSLTSLALPTTLAADWLICCFADAASVSSSGPFESDSARQNATEERRTGGRLCVGGQLFSLFDPGRERLTDFLVHLERMSDVDGFLQ
jgi:hypothetical protein